MAMAAAIFPAVRSFSSMHCSISFSNIVNCGLGVAFSAQAATILLLKRLTRMALISLAVGIAIGSIICPAARSISRKKPR
jgi:Na+/phosphate symporter